MDYDIPALSMTFDRQIQNGQRMQFEDRAIAVFYMHPEPRGADSEKEGRPIYESVPYIRIIQPGEKDTLERRANAQDKIRFHQSWAAFENQQKQQISGTPLSILFPHDPAAIKTLEWNNILTVEQLAGLQDTQIQNLGLGGRHWLEAAQSYLKAAEKGKGFQALQKDLNAKDKEITRLADIVAKLEAKVNELSKPPA